MIRPPPRRPFQAVVGGGGGAVRTYGLRACYSNSRTALLQGISLILCECLTLQLLRGCSCFCTLSHISSSLRRLRALMIVTMDFFSCQVFGEFHCDLRGELSTSLNRSVFFSSTPDEVKFLRHQKHQACS